MAENITNSISLTATAVVLSLFTLVLLLLYLFKYFSPVFQNFRFRPKPATQSHTEAESTSTQNPNIATLDETNEAGSNEEDDKPKKTLTAKQRKRQEIKEERRRLKAREDEEREERKKQLALKQEQIEAKRLEREKLIEEQEKKRKEEEEKAYQELVSSFVVESEGTITETNQHTIDDFVNYVISRKLSNVEELSARFSLKANEIIKRIQELEDQDRLFGLLDDQGRYIYISREETESILRYFKSKGKLHKQRDLVPFFNSTISLEPKPDSTQLIDLDDE